MSDAPVPELEARKGGEGAHGGAVRTMFDRIAPTYDVLNRVLSAGVDGRWRKDAVRALEGAPPGPMLDLCAGTLDLTVVLDKAFPDRDLVAADFAEKMLEAGRHKVPRARVVVADALALPFADEEFSGVVCGFGVRNLSDPVKGAREVLRALKPGGIFVTLEFFRPAKVATRLFHRAYARYVLPTVGGLVSGDRSAYAYLAASMDGFYARTEYEQALERVGFRGVRGDDLSLGIASIVRAEKPR